MASIFDTNEENNQENQTVSTTIPGSSSPSNPTGTTASPQSSGPFSSDTNKASQASNVQKYINANQTNLAGQVKDQASKDVGAAQERYGTLKSMFDTNKGAIDQRLGQGEQMKDQVSLFDMNRGSNAPNFENQQATNQIPQQFTNTFDPNTYSRQQMTDSSNLTNIISDPSQLNTFQQARDAYAGDINQLQTDFNTGGQELSNLYSKAQTGTQGFGTEEGRFKLLQDMFGSASPSYNLGQQRLDQLLVQGSGDLRQYENDLRNQFGTLDQDVAGLENEYNEFIPASQQRVQDLSQGIQDNLRGYESGLRDYLGNEVGVRTAADEQMLSDIQQRFNDKQLTTQDLDFLGIDPYGAGNMIVNDWDTLNQYLDKGQYNIDNIATADDIARYGALQQLAGDQIASEYQLALPDEAQTLDDLYNIRTTEPFGSAYDNYKTTLSGTRGTKDGIRSIHNYNSRLGTAINSQTAQQLYNDLKLMANQTSGIWGTASAEARRARAELQNFINNYNQSRFDNSLLARINQDQRETINRNQSGADFSALGLDPLNPGKIKVPTGMKGDDEEGTKTYPKK